jgi:hypothetical protein
MSDDLHARLRRADPLPPDASVDHITGGDARQLLEDIMQTEPKEERATGLHARLLVGIVGAAAAVLLAVVLAGGGDTDDSAPDETVASPPLVLGTPDPMMMSSCMALDATVLRDVELAFKGTTTAIVGEQVTLTVDEWYKGGDATTVELTSPDYQGISLEGIEFAEGTSYLVSATADTVNACGWSGEATPELQAIFDEAFSG